MKIKFLIFDQFDRYIYELVWFQCTEMRARTTRDLQNLFKTMIQKLAYIIFFLFLLIWMGFFLHMKI